MTASFVLGRVDVFPQGTTVGAYKASDWPPTSVPPTGAPPGAAVNSQAMGAGSLTFTGLTEGERYFAGASVGGTWKYVGFTASSALGSGAAQQFGAFTDGQFAKWDAASGKFVGAAAGAQDPLTLAQGLTLSDASGGSTKGVTFRDGAGGEKLYSSAVSELKTDADFRVGSLIRFQAVGGGAGVATIEYLVVNNFASVGKQFELGDTGGLGYVLFHEQSSDPSAPAADTGKLFMKDNGAGKTQLCVRFATGAIQVIATQP